MIHLLKCLFMITLIGIAIPSYIFAMVFALIFWDFKPIKAYDEFLTEMAKYTFNI